MSTFECGDSVVLGDGDGSRRVGSYQKPLAKRTPVPSCRRFATRQNQPRDDLARIKLEQALTTLQKPSPASKNVQQRQQEEDRRLPIHRRKRSKTMAEITPTKRKPVDPNLSGDGPTRPPPPRRDDAARLVYQKLLLNSWRRRRGEVATLTESSDRLQAQVDQLQIQVDVLQKLRESEGRRRSASANENTGLRKEREELRYAALNIEEDNGKLRNDIQNLERVVMGIEAKNQNLKNELNTARCEIIISEKKATKEKILNGSLRDENLQLMEKLAVNIKNAENFKKTVETLKIELESSEKNLEAANTKIVSLQEDKWALIDKQRREIKCKNSVNQQLIDEKEKRTQIEKKLQELKRTVVSLSGVRSKLTDDNVCLKRTVANLEHTLAQERAQKWWKNAATTIVDTLQNAATIMLPAFPRNHKNKYTSTTDLPPRGSTGK